MRARPDDDCPTSTRDWTGRLARALDGLRPPLPELAVGRIASYLGELARWNRAYNLTAVTAPEDMIERHVLDSLSIRPYLRGRRIVDAGTGAGLPGIILAIAEPDRHFVLVDSSNKKIRFVRHVARSLALDNVEVVHARLETAVLDPPPDEIVARALAPLPRLVDWLSPWLERGARLLAMKGPRVREEAEGLPNAYRVDVEPIRCEESRAERLLARVERADGPGGAAPQTASADA